MTYLIWIILIIIFIIGLILIVVGSAKLTDNNCCFIGITGQVVSAECVPNATTPVTYTCKVSVQYDYNGSFTKQVKYTNLINPLQPGNSVTIFIDPNDPGKNPVVKIGNCDEGNFEIILGLIIICMYVAMLNPSEALSSPFLFSFFF